VAGRRVIAPLLPLRRLLAHSNARTYARAARIGSDTDATGSAVKIIFELEPADIARLDAALDRARERVECADEIDIVDAARASLERYMQANLPSYVRRQFGAVQHLIEMLEDEAWALPGRERDAILRTLVYFSDPEDLIPDDEEVVGLLDDAIMLAFILRRLKPVLAAYDEYLAFRSTLGATPRDCAGRIEHARQLAERRDALHARLARRARRWAA
jgi:uncharacterized membrane protein YkvA (DUF1232 family)